MNAQHWRLLIFLMVAEVMSAFESSMVLASLAAWQRELRDPVMVGWIVTSYLLVSAAASALFGRLGDIFGRKRVLIGVVALAGLGSLISATASSVWVVIFGRGIQGAAGAIIPLCFGLVNEHLPKEKVPFGVSMIVATAATASAIGLFLGGVLTDHFGPISIFTASAALAAIIIPILAIGLPTSPRKRLPKDFDWLGGALYAPGVGAMLFAISEFGKSGSAIAVALSLLSAIGLLGWWYVHERGHPNPLIDVRQLANRNCLLANLAMLAAAAGVMQLTQVTSLLIQQPPETGTGLGKSATFLGAIKLPTVFVGVIGSLSAAWLISRVGQRLPIIAGALLIGLPTAIIAYNQTDLVVIIAVICLTSIGINMVYAAIPTVIMAVTPGERVSEATGLMAVFRATGQAIGAQAIAALMAVSLVTLPSGRVYTSGTGYTFAFLFMTITAILLVASTLRMRVGKVAKSGGG